MLDAVRRENLQMQQDIKDIRLQLALPRGVDMNTAASSAPNDAPGGTLPDSSAPQDGSGGKPPPVVQESAVPRKDEAPPQHPLFPEVDPATMHMHRGIDDDGDGVNRKSPPELPDTPWMKPPAMNSARSPFRQDRLPPNPYQTHPSAQQTQRTGNLRESVDRTQSV
jgi:hypothetical protein